MRLVCLLLMVVIGAISYADVWAHPEDGVRASILLESGESLTAEQAIEATMTPASDIKLNLGYQESAAWVRLDFPTIPQDPIIISSCYIQLDSLTLYLPKDGSWIEQKSGDRERYSFPHRCLSFKVEQLDQPFVLLKAKSSGRIYLPLSVETVETFWQETSKQAFGHGLYFAVLLAMCIYNFFLYLIIKDRAYLYYVGYLLGISLFLASMNGYAKYLLWPNSTLWAHLAPITAATVAICAGGGYIKLLTRADRFAPSLDRGFKYLVPLGIIVVVTNVFTVRPAIMLLGVLMITMLVMATIAIVRSARAGYKPGKVLLLGIGLMFPGALTYYLRTVGLIEESWLSNNVLFLTTSGEAMIMSIALAYRIEALNEEVDAHRQTTLDMRINFSRDLIKAIDSERRNIARELHDGLGQGLLAIKSMVNRVDNGEIKNSATTIIRNLISDIRNMARNMHPQQIENLGFATALETMFTETITPAGAKLGLQLEDVSGMLSKDQELHLYRIAQECASNIVRHADASKVDVKLIHQNGVIRMTIGDNGKGLDNQNSEGLGIFSIHERAAIIGADAKFSAADGGGTLVSVEVQRT